MKSYIIILIALLFKNNILAQNCADCKDRKYPYFVCKGDVISTLCTNDPQHIGDGSRVLKKCLTSFNLNNINYDDTKSPYPVGKRIFQTNSGVEYDVYSGTKAKDLVKKGLSDWMNSCANGNAIDNTNCDDCTLKVQWASDIAEWKNLDKNPTSEDDPNNVLAYLSEQQFKVATGNQKDCRVDCSSSRIVINGTNSFLGGTTRPPYNFFYTDRNNKTYPQNDPKVEREYYDFYGVITHEIGHWLGFAHSDPNCQPGDNAQRNMMTGSGLPSYQDQDLTNDDRCRFMKLYCCLPNSGIENDSTLVNSDFTISPNPARSGSVVIEPSISGTIVRYYISDINGKILIVKENSSIGKFEIDIESLVSGKYIITMEYNRNYRIWRELKLTNESKNIVSGLYH